MNSRPFTGAETEFNRYLIDFVILKLECLDIQHTVVIGVSYTVFSEWLNIEIRGAWAYRDGMPVIPLLDAGLSPVLQWILVPLAGFWWTKRPAKPEQR